MDKISGRGVSPRTLFVIRSQEVSGAIGCSATRVTVDPAAGIVVEIGIAWIGAETRIVVGGTTAVTVVTVLTEAVAATTEADDRMVVGVAAAVVIARSVLSPFSFHSRKS